MQFVRMPNPDPDLGTLLRLRRQALLKAATTFADKERIQHLTWESDSGSLSSPTPAMEQAALAAEVAETALLARALEWAACSLAYEAEAMQAGAQAVEQNANTARIARELGEVPPRLGRLRLPVIREGQ